MDISYKIIIAILSIAAIGIMIERQSSKKRLASIKLDGRGNADRVNGILGHRNTAGDSGFF